jgi:hypothetical protein
MKRFAFIWRFASSSRETNIQHTAGPRASVQSLEPGSPFGGCGAESGLMLFQRFHQPLPDPPNTRKPCAAPFLPILIHHRYSAALHISKTFSDSIAEYRTASITKAGSRILHLRPQTHLAQAIQAPVPSPKWIGDQPRKQATKTTNLQTCVIATISAY